MIRLLLWISLGFITLEAHLNITVSYPYIGALTHAVGGDRVQIQTLAQGGWDPHFVVPKPSLITKVRTADLLIINGADLEIGWLPPLLERSANRNINNPANQLDLSKTIKLMDIPTDLSRASGDVHADGNPHFHLDPRNIPVLADAIAAFLIQKDPKNITYYRNNLNDFKQKWDQNLKRWEKKMVVVRGEGVIQYHPVFNYFIRAFGLKTVGTIEPLAGIPPSSAHTMKLIRTIEESKPKWILHDVYHPTKTGKFIAEKTGIKLIVLPHDIDEKERANTLIHLFDTLTESFQ